ncbi:hypothetical protein [Rhizomicrobium electricum]|uniref:Uncharacterized protein n=1 Tax=Rhizomicrobium electricum TaxID=480070 RepID=A0ABP3PHJ9_9PROT|nr:hypothetical protein [Rhizomicrobium electricum]NIJ48293.1 hypothetical protein [Rhizomicrobium electricum]
MSADLRNALVLVDAARRAYQVALSEGLSLAHIAEQSGHPQYWFANSILHVVDVYGVRTGESAPVLLSRDLVANLKLADDMLVLIDPDTGETKFGDLKTASDQVDRYLAWARTVY